MLPLIDLLGPVIEKALSFIPDPAKREAAKLETLKELDAHSEKILASIASVDVAQAKINEVDAGSLDKFRAWARPAAMWISVVGLAWSVIPIIVGQFFVWTGRPAPLVVALPSFVVNTLLYGLLGLGAYRSVDLYNEVRK
jgi:hypothetical protein